jgi:thiamine pyrophosphate-dependent acetolactate synthase large subunit-like protein
MMFERRAAMATLLANRPNNLFVVPGLGSCTWDAFAAGDDDRNFYLWGAMGGAAMIGLGLALAKPNARVAVITGDGEMLMGLGSLATIGVQKPKNSPLSYSTTASTARLACRRATPAAASTFSTWRAAAASNA